MIKLVIFDLDGTLINSIVDLADAVNLSLEEYGYPTHEVKKYYHFVGNGTLKLCERALPEEKRTPEIINKLHTRFAERYAKNCTAKTVIYDGVNSMLEELKNRGIKIAVASNKTDSFCKEIISELFGNTMFDLVMGKLDGVPTKPSPEIVYAVMNEQNVDKTECLFVGDSNVDVVTAHNAGLKCIGCSWGFRGRDELEKAGADFVVDKAIEILKCI